MAWTTLEKLAQATGCEARETLDPIMKGSNVDWFRSLLFVPGNREDMLSKAQTLPADALVPDWRTQCR